MLDWEENLWGTSPTEKETTTGIPDGVAIEKLKTQKEEETKGEEGIENQDDEELTETEKFSREFFSLVATLSQNGVMDEATIDKLSSSLAEQIKSSTPRRVFTLSEIKVTQDNTTPAIQKYNDSINSIFDRHPAQYTVPDVLQEFIADGNNENPEALLKLGPIADQAKKILNELQKISAPQSLAPLHLEMLNGFQRVIENINDIKLYETDVIVSLRGISQYETNVTLLSSIAQNLANVINKKLNN